MGRTSGSYRVAVLILVIGLCVAPAAMADQGRGHDGPQGFFASIDHLVQSLVAEMGEWLGAVVEEQSIDDGAALDPIESDPASPESGGPDNTTDSGPIVDPDG